MVHVWTTSLFPLPESKYNPKKLSFYNDLLLSINVTANIGDPALSRRLAKLAISLVTCVVAIPAASPSTATPSTSRGLISVAQVMQMLEKAPTDRTAQQVLAAYLAGVGEAAGAVVSMGNATCRTSLRVNAGSVRQALKAAAAGQDTAETPATPLIVKDMLDRAGCKRQ
ncbi:chlorophyllide reductase [Aminobacter aminovorans]|uniref:Chlorophyllide reductase n=1 Tax=Aminobacter aminovorans TaxID=83263 RepID=A0ABR6H9W8_AMIAI|nr:chlorophyllide reductase [Aminobacter aminovorans]MBB3707328.1 hypothetical protein [Aminobacter aminovorans]